MSEFKFLSIVTILVVTTGVFELSQLELSSSHNLCLVTIEFWDVIFKKIEFCHHLSFWVVPFRFVWVCHNLFFWVLSQFELMSCHNLSLIFWGATAVVLAVCSCLDILKPYWQVATVLIVLNCLHRQWLVLYQPIFFCWTHNEFKSFPV